MADYPWWEQALRDHDVRNGPSGDAWNISSLLDLLRKAAPSEEADLVSLPEEIQRQAEANQFLTGPRTVPGRIVTENLKVEPERRGGCAPEIRSPSATELRGEDPAK